MNIIDRQLRRLAPDLKGIQASNISNILYHDHAQPTRREVMRAIEHEAKTIAWINARRTL